MATQVKCPECGHGFSRWDYAIVEAIEVYYVDKVCNDEDGEPVLWLGKNCGYETVGITLECDECHHRWAWDHAWEWN